MNPVEQYAPSPEELRFMALEQALADSQAEGKETQRQLTMLLNGFKRLKKLLEEQQTPPTPPTIPVNINPVRAAPTGRPPPPHCHLSLMVIGPMDKHFLILVKHTYVFVQTLSPQMK